GRVIEGFGRQVRPLRRCGCCLAVFAIQVEPAPVPKLEAAEFVQPRGPPALAVAGNEFDCGVSGVLLSVLPDLQAQPFQVGRVRIQPGRARMGMPGVEQVLQLVEHEGAVARAHQGDRGGRLQVARAAMPGFAAAAVGLAAATRAGRRHGGWRSHWPSRSWYSGWRSKYATAYEQTGRTRQPRWRAVSSAARVSSA